MRRMRWLGVRSIVFGKTALLGVAISASVADSALADRDYELEVKKILKRVENLELTDDEGDKAIEKAMEAKISRLDMEKEIASATFGGRRLVYAEMKEFSGERIHMFTDKGAVDAAIGGALLGVNQEAVKRALAPKLYCFKDAWFSQKPPTPEKADILTRFYSVALGSNSSGEKYVHLTVLDKEGKDITAAAFNEVRLKQALSYGLNAKGEIRHDAKPMTQDERFKAVDGKQLRYLRIQQIAPDAFVRHFELYENPSESFCFLPDELVSADNFFGEKLVEGSVYKAGLVRSILDLEGKVRVGLSLVNRLGPAAPRPTADKPVITSDAKPMTFEDRFKAIEGKLIIYAGTVEYESRLLHRFDLVGGKSDDGMCFTSIELASKPVKGATYKPARKKGFLGSSRLELLKVEEHTGVSGKE